MRAQDELDRDRLVFIDETWASTNMARTHGRCLRGERLRASIPHGPWKTTTCVAALTTRGIIAPWVLDGSINRDAFETDVKKVLTPELPTDAIRDHGKPLQPQRPARPRDDRGCRRNAALSSALQPAVPRSTPLTISPKVSLKEA